MENRIRPRLKIYLDEEIQQAEKNLAIHRKKDTLDGLRLMSIDQGRLDLAKRLLKLLEMWDK